MADDGWFSSVRSFASNITDTALGALTAIPQGALSVTSAAVGLVSTDAAKAIDNVNQGISDVRNGASEAVGSAANWAADRVGQGDGTTITDHAGDRKAEEWKDSGYDTSIFTGANQDGISEDALQTNVAWLKACANVYEMKGGGSLEFLDKTALDELKAGRIPANLNPDQLKELGEWGMGEMSWFNNNIVATGKAAVDVLNGTPEQRMAYLFMMEAYEHKNMSLEGWGRGLVAMGADPTTYVGIASFGVGFAAKEGAKAAGKVAFREALKLGMREAMEEAAERGLQGAARRTFMHEARDGILSTARSEGIRAGTRVIRTQVALGATDGVISAAAFNASEQSIRINAGRQEDFSLSQFFTSTAVGGAAGGTMSVAVPAAGKWVWQGISRLFGFSADAAAPAVSRAADNALSGEGTAAERALVDEASLLDNSILDAAPVTDSTMSDNLLARLMPSDPSAPAPRAANDEFAPASTPLSAANDDIAYAEDILRGTGTDGPVYMSPVEITAPGGTVINGPFMSANGNGTTRGGGWTRGTAEGTGSSGTGRSANDTGSSTGGTGRGPDPEPDGSTAGRGADPEPDPAARTDSDADAGTASARADSTAEGAARSTKHLQFKDRDEFDDWIEDDLSNLEWWKRQTPEDQARILKRVEAGKPFLGPEAKPSRGAEDSTNANPNTSSGSSDSRTASRTSPPVSPLPEKPAIEIPAFDREIVDQAKWWAKRSANPLKLFTSWIPTKAFMVRSYGVTRPVIDAVDNHMQKMGIIQNVQDLQTKLLEAVRNGKDPAEILKAFQNDKNIQDNLTHFRASIQDLRRTVEETYAVAVPKRDSSGNVLKDRNGKIQYEYNPNISTKYYGLTNGGGNTPNQKQALIDYLNDMDTMAYDLQQGSNGSIGREALNNLERLRRGELSRQDIENSVTGLSRADWLVNNAEIRSTGTWGPPGQKTTVSVQWKSALERSLDVGLYNPHPPKGEPLTYGVIGDENLEQRWQNQVLDTFAKRDDKGNLEVNFTTNVQAKFDFVDALIPFYQQGYGHEAVFAIEQLRRLRQFWKGGDSDTLPKAATIRDILDTKINGAFKDDPGFKIWADQIHNALKREYPGRSGTSKWFGLHGKFVEDNRQNRFAAIERIYPIEYAFRYPGNESWMGFLPPTSKPARNEIANKYLNYPIQKFWRYFAGAQDVRPGESTQWGRPKRNYEHFTTVWRAGEGEARESILAPVRRSAVRILSVGLINDITPKNPTNILSRSGVLGMGSGLLALGGVAAWGGGAVTGQETIAAVGQEVTEYATLPTRAVWGAVLGSSEDAPPAVTVPAATGGNTGAAGNTSGGAVGADTSSDASADAGGTGNGSGTAADQPQTSEQDREKLRKIWQCLNTQETTRVQELRAEKDRLAQRFNNGGLNDDQAARYIEIQPEILQIAKAACARQNLTL